MTRAACTALLLLALPLAIEAQNGPRPASIRGRVVSANTGDPIRGATVEAASAGGQRGGAATTTTDVHGLFEITGLPAGQYRVSAYRTGFVTRQLGQRSPFENVDPVLLSAGQTMTIDLALTRGSAIVGRVFDEAGEPIAEARVQAMRVQRNRGRTQLIQMGTTRMTDDLGVYRLYSLPPGEYLVMATPGTETPGVPPTAPTYYPGTPRVSDAHRLTLSLAGEEYNVNFSLAGSPLVDVTGRVVDVPGMPLRARVELIPELADTRGTAYAAESAVDGSFTIAGVPPGAYHVVANGRAEDREPLLAWFRYDVGRENVSGLTVVTSSGATLGGTLVNEGTARGSLDGIRIVAQPSGATAGRGPVAATVSGERFQLTGLAGPYTIDIDRLPSGYGVRSLTAAGVDVTDGSVDFRPGENVLGQLRVTNRLAELFGTVRAAGRPAPGVSILVFPADPARWTGASRAIRTARSDRNGAFAIRSLIPGQRYLAVAVDYLDDGDEQDPEFLRRMAPRASVLAAAADQNRILDLTLVPR